MSGRGAAVVIIAAIILLGALALWLVNVPGWAILTVVLAASGVARSLVRWLLKRADRQKTEA